MAWTRAILLALLPVVLVLTVLSGTESAVVTDGKDAEPRGPLKRVFMPQSDATSFFRGRGRRSVRQQAETIAEQQQHRIQSERTREYYEDKRSKYENYLEEDRKEEYERSLEIREQWRQYNYDGRIPHYPYNRPHV